MVTKGGIKVREIKYRIRLKDQKTGELLTIHVPLFNEANGLMNFPVDLEQWEVLRIDEYTGLRDKNDKEIYDQDLWLPLGCESPRVVKWYKNGWWLHHPRTDAPLRLLEYPEDGENVGNVYENPTLLEPII